MVAGAEKSRRGRSSRRGHSRSVRRVGARQDLRHGPDRKDQHVRLVRGRVRRHLRYRHDSPRLFRHRSAEEEIPAEDRDRGIALRVLSLGATGRLRFARVAHARSALAGRQELDPQRAEDVDHQRWIRRRVHRFYINTKGIKRREAIKLLHTGLKSTQTPPEIPLSVYQQASSKGQDIQHGGDSFQDLCSMAQKLTFERDTSAGNWVFRSG